MVGNMSASSVKLWICKSNSFARFLRYYSNGNQKFAYKYNKLDSNHPYVNLFPWKSRDEFVDAIEKSVIYNQDGIVAINKPFGVPVIAQKSDGKKPRTVVQTMSTSGILDCVYSMEEILPFLQARLNLSSLSIVKSPERFTSGIMLLAASENAATAISKSMKRSVAKQVIPFSYWTVTTVIPQAHQKFQKVGIRLLEIKEYDQKAPIIEPKVSTTAIRSQSLIPVLVQMKILAINNIFNTALVEVEASKTKMHFLRVYMAHKLAPILGDGMYSGRVKLVLGKPVTVSPFNRAAYDTRLLSDNLNLQLHMPRDKTESIPTHLHLHQVTLDGLEGKKDLILNCSPPEHFMWTLSQLGLKFEPQIQQEAAISN